MKIEFKNKNDLYVTFTDDGIIYGSKYGANTYPYETIRDLKISRLGSLVFTTDGKECTFNVDGKDEKQRMKDAIQMVREEKLEAIWQEQIQKIYEELDIIPSESANSEHSISKHSLSEHRMRCNTCGHIFCYTDADVRENEKNAKLGAFAAVGAIAATLGGSAYMAVENNKLADRQANKFIDYNKCPKCNSISIQEMSEEEWAQSHTNTTTASAPDPYDELKKLKELLDMDIITQEEFDTKKKQLLGL